MRKFWNISHLYVLPKDIFSKGSKDFAEFGANNQFRVHFEVERIVSTVINSLPATTGCLQTSSLDFETLLAGGKFADVTLVVEGQELKAHKAILAARSPIFAEMFANDEQKSRVIIDDVSLEVFKELLYYIYTAKTDAYRQFAAELLAAADKVKLVYK